MLRAHEWMLGLYLPKTGAEVPAWLRHWAIGHEIVVAAGGDGTVRHSRPR